MTPEIQKQIEALNYRITQLERDRQDIAERTYIDRDLQVNGKIILNGLSIKTGAGAPTYSATSGSLYMRTDGAEQSSLYVNHDGSTGWQALGT